jgi:hypothetical protein
MTQPKTLAEFRARLATAAEMLKKGADPVITKTRNQVLMMDEKITHAEAEAEKLWSMKDTAPFYEFLALAPVDGLTVLVLLGRVSEHAKRVLKEARSKQAKIAADAKHKPNRKKRKDICAIWKAGNFLTRDDCAYEEHEALGMKLRAARDALIGTPDPNPWLAKEKQRRPA